MYFHQSVFILNSSTYKGEQRILGHTKGALPWKQKGRRGGEGEEKGEEEGQEEEEPELFPINKRHHPFIENTLNCSMN